MQKPQPCIVCDNGTGFDMALAVEEALARHFGVFIPVIDPGKVALHFARAMVEGVEQVIITVDQAGIGGR